MTLRSKTLLITGAIMVGLVALLFLISNLILESSVAREEQQSVNQSVVRAAGILDYEILDLASIVGDWAPWDDTYAFIEDGNAAYIRSNLVDSTFSNLRLNLMLFVHSSGRVVYVKAFDLQTGKEMPVPASLKEQLTPDNPLLQHPDLRSKTSGIMLLPEGPLLVASNPILTSNEEGPIRGTMIVGRFLNDAEAALLPQLTRSSVSVNRFDDPRVAHNVQSLGASGEKLPILIQSQNDQFATGYTLLRDIYGKPALVLSVDVPRTDHEQAQESLHYFLAALLAVSLIFGLANRAVLNAFILSRLDQLRAEIHGIGLSGDLTARLTTTGRDELAHLAERINGMLAALENSQRQRLESEQRYRAVVQETTEGIFLLDMKTLRILEANAAFQNLVGYSADELTVLTMYDFVADERADIDENMKRLQAEKRLSFSERKFLRKSGSLVEVEASANIIIYGGREVACVIVRDVTQRKWTEDALRRNEAYFRALIDNSLDVIGILNIDGTVCYLSPTIERMLGFKPERLIGRNAFDMIHPDDAANVKSVFTIGIENPGFTASVEFRLQDQKGSWLNVETAARSLLDNPAVMGIVFSLRDITARKRAEQRLRESEERYRQAVENSPNAIFSVNREGIIQTWNHACENIFQYGQEIIRRDVGGLLLNAEDRPCVADTVEQVFQRQALSDVEISYRCQDGTERIMTSRLYPLLDGGGEVEGCVFANTDITARKRAEQRLTKLNECFLRLGADPKANINRLVAFCGEQLGATCALYNRLQDGQLCALGQWNAPSDFQTVDDPEGHIGYDLIRNGGADVHVIRGLAQTRYAQTDPDVLRYGLKTYVGKAVSFRGTGVGSLCALYQEDHVPGEEESKLLGIVASAIGVEEERLRTVEALRESEERYRRLVELSPDAIAIHAEGRIVFANPAAARLMGAASFEQLIGKPLLDLVHPDYRDLVKERVRQQREEGNTLPPVEEKFIRLDGAVVDVETAASPFTYQGKPAVQVIVHDITERKRREAEIHRRADEFAALLETSRDLGLPQDLPTVLHTIVERAAKLLSAACGGIYLYDPARGDLLVSVATHPAIPLGARLQIGEGMAGRVAQTRQPLIVDDYQIWEGRSTKFDGIPVRAIVEVPMLHGGELIGVLLVEEIGDTTRRFTEEDARLLSLFAAQAASAVYNANLLQKTRDRAEQLALLYDAGLALNSVLEPRAQLEFLFKIAQRTLHADRAEFFRYDLARRELRFELGVGYPEGTRTAVRELAFALDTERGVVGQVAQERIPQYLPDVSADPRWIAVDPEIRSALWVPVEREKRLLGVLSVLSNRTHAFTPQDERLLVLFANQAAVALENARLFEETRRRADQLAVLNRIASALSQTLDLDELLEVIYREINATLQGDAFFIALYDDATGEMNYRIRIDGGVREPPERRRLAPGLTAHVIQNKKSLLIHDWELEKDHYPPIRLWGSMKPPRAWLAVPMLFRDTVVGVISLQSYQPNAFGEEEERLLATIADQAAVAVEKARLFAETDHRLHRLHALGDIDRAISSSLDLRVTLEVVLDQVTTQLRVDAADILLHNPRTQMLAYGSSRGFRSRALQYTELRFGEGLAGTAALERRIVHFPDLTLEADGLRRSPLLAQEGFIAYFAVPLIAKGEVKGVLEIFHRTSLEPDQEWLDFAQALGAQAAIAIDDAELFQDLQRTNVELSLAYEATIEGWSRALELRDQETEGHGARVTELTLRLARRLGMSEEELVQVRRGTLLHDIGKMAIPDSILFKSGELSAAEWEIMRRHPTYAYEMLSPIAYLRQALEIPYCHHEKWDGTGYPRGLKGEQIPLAARIFAVVDVWDALRSDRRYRPERSEGQTRAYIREQAGKHFDPKVVDEFLKIDAEKR